MSSLVPNTFALPFIRADFHDMFKDMFKVDLWDFGRELSGEERQIVVDAILPMRNEISRSQKDNPLFSALQAIISPDFTWPFALGKVDTRLFERRCMKFANSAPYEEFVLLDAVVCACSKRTEPEGRGRMIKTIQEVIKTRI